MFTIYSITPDVSVNSIDGIQSWFWDFGDGSPALLLHHQHIHIPVPGNYRFRLRVVTNGGCVDSVNIPNAITVGNLPPVGGADFTGAPLNSMRRNTCQFCDLSPNPLYLYQAGFGILVMAVRPSYAKPIFTLSRYRQI